VCSVLFCPQHVRSLLMLVNAGACIIECAMQLLASGDRHVTRFCKVSAGHAQARERRQRLRRQDMTLSATLSRNSRRINFLCVNMKRTLLTIAHCTKALACCSSRLQRESERSYRRRRRPVTLMLL
jgi:hypothetical protein